MAAETYVVNPRNPRMLIPASVAAQLAASAPGAPSAPHPAAYPLSASGAPAAHPALRPSEPRGGAAAPAPKSDASARRAALLRAAPPRALPPARADNVPLPPLGRGAPAVPPAVDDPMSLLLRSLGAE